MSPEYKYVVTLKNYIRPLFVMATSVSIEECGAAVFFGQGSKKVAAFGPGCWAFFAIEKPESTS